MTNNPFAAMVASHKVEKPLDDGLSAFGEVIPSNYEYGASEAIREIESGVIFGTDCTVTIPYPVTPEQEKFIYSLWEYGVNKKIESWIDGSGTINKRLVDIDPELFKVEEAF